MKHQIVRNIKRADAAVIRTLGEQGVATIHEAQERTGLLNPYLRPIYREAKVAGSAVTVSCQPGDNLMIHAALEVCQPGDVLVFRMRTGAIAKHMGIVAQTGAQASFVHAYDRHGVVESPLSAPWRARIAGRFRFPPL